MTAALHVKKMAPKDSTVVHEPVKIDKWDGSAVKNALDDAIKEVFTKKFNYVENFTLIDLRLTMCGVAVAVALFALLWDHLNPFPQSKPVLIFCVSSYFVMMGILTLYTTYKEKGIFVIAIQKDSSGSEHIWEASSYLKKYDDQYNFHLIFRDGKTGKMAEGSWLKSVASFIDVNGIVLYDLVEVEVVKLHNSLLQESKKDK